MNELLPCPACGSENLRIRCNPIHKNWNAMSAVACDDCYTQGPTVIGDEAAIKAWNALPRALHWTKEPPTKPGWYLWREGNRGKVYVVILSTIEAARFHIKEDTCEWAGPIPEPKEK